MEPQRPKIELPLEKELTLYQIKSRLKSLSKEELEVNLTEALQLLVRLTHQTGVLLAYIAELEGKLSQEL